MSVAPEHINLVVACPHCSEPVEPWRVAAAGQVPFKESEQGPLPPPPPVGAPSPLYGGAGYRGYASPQALSSRNKVVAGLLGLFLGSLGAHRFYLGFIGIGILQMVLTFATCGVAGFWGFVEGILCLAGQMRDVDGLPLRD